MNGAVLIIEDDDTLRLGITQAIKKMDCRVYNASGGPKGIELFRRYHPELVITDYRMAPMDGLAVLKEIKQLDPATDVMIITAHGSPEIMLEAEKFGASEFIFKPFPLTELEVRVSKAFRLRGERHRNELKNAELEYLREEARVSNNMGDLVGSSDKMQEIFDNIQKVASTTSSILITGESGTGKELVAKAIHYSGNRQEHPFVKVNCSALAKGVLESELFGHEKGSFTGALNQRIGRFELADKGTIFLDEIGDIDAEIQVKLLRVLQEKEFERVGGEKTLNVDVRIIAATNRDLDKAVRDGQFREDLYYRLNIIPIPLPPLRERMDDLPDLVVFIIKKLSRDLNKPHLQIDQSIISALRAYHWPGNIRELENILERAAVLCDKDVIAADDLPVVANVQDNESPNGFDENLDLTQQVELFERRLITRALDVSGDNKAEAARQLGIKTSTLYYKLEKHDLIDKSTLSES
jgi:two-component system, NtrC family, response regulator HydG